MYNIYTVTLHALELEKKKKKKSLYVKKDSIIQVS